MPVEMDVQNEIYVGKIQRVPLRAVWKAGNAVPASPPTASMR
jgi:hypothetical protein